MEEKAVLKIRNRWLLLGLVILSATTFFYGQTTLNTIEINFPMDWTLSPSNSGTSATNSNKTAQIFVTNTKYTTFKLVQENILSGYLQKNFTNLIKIYTESGEGEGITRSLVIYRGIATNNKQPIYLVTQLAALTNNPNFNVVLYTGIIRESEGRQVLESVNQSFRTLQISGSSGNVSTPLAPIRPTTTTPVTSPASTNSSPVCPGSKLTQAEIKSILKQHNDARAAVGVLPLTWNCDLANYAQKWANRGIFEHSDSEQLSGIIPGIQAGENLAADTEPNAPPDVQGWLDEGQFWNNQTATCKEGEICGHYTQIVWRTTTQIGCGINRKTPGEYKQFFVCNYSPGGNEPGPAY